MTSALATPQAIVVFAHGSRDPLWRIPVEQVAEKIAASAPGVAVRCAYLELTEPDLPTVVGELVATLSIATNPASMPTIRVFPLFFGVGRHAREDLPALVADLRGQYPAWRFELMRSAGEHASVLEAAAACALAPLLP
jgi:sirohydrochlorin cobaltochelatase